MRILDPRANGLFRVGEALARLATGATWSEGPVWMHEDGSVLWSAIPNNRMLRWHSADGMSVWRDHVEFTNDLAFSPDESVLYVSDTSAALRRDRGGNHHIVAFNVIEGRGLTNPRVFAVIDPGLSDAFLIACRMGNPIAMGSARHPH